MSEKTPETEHFRTFSNISAKQEMFIAAMLSLPTITAAARASGVTDKTARLWMKQSHVQEAYRLAKQIAFAEVLEGLRDHAKGAIDTIKDIMDSTEVDPAVRLRAGNIILMHAIQIHRAEELESRLLELEEAIRNKP